MRDGCQQWVLDDGAAGRAGRRGHRAWWATGQQGVLGDGAAARAGRRGSRVCRCQITRQGGCYEAVGCEGMSYRAEYLTQAMVVRGWMGQQQLFYHR
ncbi:unnamed protein product [Closterium sp. NIES-64]|nr:unnamed protein product [Closterium sp. NIES-64]